MSDRDRQQPSIYWLVKAYSASLNLFGAAGPIPEGMETTALRNLTLSARHEGIKKKVLAQAAAFREKQVYKAPSWELVRRANKSRLELAGQSR